MGKLLGSHGSEELDRPDLNKCPDCNCFFAGNNCPLCGKECPEEFRAGNREKVKPQKRRQNRGSDRVEFISWYHRWWFIILMLIFVPLAGIVLFITSPHKTWVKITFATLAAVWMLMPFVAGGLFNLIGIFTPPEEYVDTSMSYEQYVEACEDVTLEEFYRSADHYKDKFITLTLTVSEKFTDYIGYMGDEEHTIYYICKAENEDFEILVRDCQIGDAQNFIAGDVITVYGIGAGNQTVYDMETVAHSAPCINMAYAKIK